MPEGRQSPPPERQTGAQQQDPPASGKGTDNASNKEQTNKESLDVRVFHSFPINPAHPLSRES